MIRNRKIVLYELNEVPHRVLLDFADRHPSSTCARLLEGGRLYGTHAEDGGILSPWITWPTLHRGVTNEQHCISDFGQDLDEVNAQYPAFFDLVARAGRSVGVFGSLHTYPLPENVGDYAFYVPDTFANGPECFPETLTPFQDFNLKMMDASGRNVSRSVAVAPALRFLVRARSLGLTVDTTARLAGQVIIERANRARVGRRRTSQTQIAFDLFYKQLCVHKPDLATFFTNHVASSRHRYWPARFPQDFKDETLGAEWHRTYSGEIDFTMNEADRELAKLSRFVERHSGYALVVASSMGQAAVDASVVVRNQLYITNIDAFMRAVGVAAAGWTRHRAMLPRYIFRLSPSQVEVFRSAANAMTINGSPLQVSELGSDIFQVKVGQPNLSDENTVVTLRGERRALHEVGLSNVAIEDETGSYAYHIPQGTLLVYDPADQATSRRNCGTISTREIAPTILANFGVSAPPYMMPPVASQVSS